MHGPFVRYSDFVYAYYCCCSLIFINVVAISPIANFVVPSDLEYRLLGPAFEEAIYTSPATIKTALQAYAKANRFAISSTLSTPTQVVFSFSKGGKYNNCNQGHVYKSKTKLARRPENS